MTLVLPDADELLAPGPWLVARLGAAGNVRLVLRSSMHWLRACRLLEGLPGDYAMRLA